MSLTMLYAGQIAPTVEVFKGAQVDAEIIILDEDGAPVDLTGGSVDLEVHAGKARTDTPEATFAASLTAATAGHATLTILSAAMTLTVGTHYAYILYTTAGSELFYGPGQVQLNVK